MPCRTARHPNVALRYRWSIIGGIARSGLAIVTLPSESRRADWSALGHGSGRNGRGAGGISGDMVAFLTGHITPSRLGPVATGVTRGLRSDSSPGTTP